MKTHIAILAIAFGLTGLNSGCNAISGTNQAALDASSQTTFGLVLNNNPQDYAAFVKVYPLLFTIPTGQLNSYQIGQAVAGLKGGPTSKGAADLTNAFDAVIRNVTQLQTGGTGTASLGQAIQAQIVGVVADGYWHALNTYAGLHGLPAVPEIVPTTTTVPAPAS